MNLTGCTQSSGRSLHPALYRARPLLPSCITTTCLHTSYRHSCRCSRALQCAHAALTHASRPWKAARTRPPRDNGAGGVRLMWRRLLHRHRGS
ncbi:hypothetical protein GWK47_018797 [Chionoecetes opilio]|uniref:Uncharacterized protein n=1 Tax=Chionoecetes opilio TaxID=41210 RepID=A0A8J4XZE8_CHIOP|nr:hypothetical protein GWK47_018797 [Chionoecetes opilio]